MGKLLAELKRRHLYRIAALSCRRKRIPGFDRPTCWRKEAEITAALAKVQGLTVIGRTSAFEYKGQNRDLRAIGQALGVTHLIEGSVRKDGSRVRITAQLIRADNAAHLWTENYDRQLTDIFATQEDIA